MRFGATVQGRIVLEDKRIVQLPSSALFQSNNSPAVWVFDPASSTVKLRPVTILRYEIDHILVAEGLNEGDRVVTAGVQKLFPGNEGAAVVTNSDGSGVNLSEWALKHRSFISYLMLMFMVAGTWAYFVLGRSEDPTFTCKSMLVKVLSAGGRSPKPQISSPTSLRKNSNRSRIDFLGSQTKAGETTIMSI